MREGSEVEEEEKKQKKEKRWNERRVRNKEKQKATKIWSTDITIGYVLNTTSQYKSYRMLKSLE